MDQRVRVLRVGLLNIKLNFIMDKNTIRIFPLNENDESSLLSQIAIKSVFYGLEHFKNEFDKEKITKKVAEIVKNDLKAMGFNM